MMLLAPDVRPCLSGQPNPAMSLASPSLESFLNEIMGIPKTQEQLAICEDIARKAKKDVRRFPGSFFTACATLLLVVTTQRQPA